MDKFSSGEVNQRTHNTAPLLLTHKGAQTPPNEHLTADRLASTLPFPENPRALASRATRGGRTLDSRPQKINRSPAQAKASFPGDFNSSTREKCHITGVSEPEKERLPARTRCSRSAAINMQKSTHRPPPPRQAVVTCGGGFTPRQRWPGFSLISFNLPRLQPDLASQHTHASPPLAQTTGVRIVSLPRLREEDRTSLSRRS
ncbi:hypothetical protein O3P69_017922 [Scylla paramamosain]|uniref:Uncharacterized protein n=1 Tax=Scylla paramamosain TaxID=85552 RepID=A0AAW0TGP9_SCYPA